MNDILLYGPPSLNRCASFFRKTGVRPALPTALTFPYDHLGVRESLPGSGSTFQFTRESH